MIGDFEMEKPKMKVMNLQTVTGLLISEQCNYKKCVQYQSLATDPALTSLFEQTSKCHKNRYEQLLKYLQSHC